MCLELLQAVTIHVAVAINPLQTAACGLLVLPEQRVISQPLPGLVQRDQIKRSRVGGSVVGRVRNLFAGGEFADADLVQNLTRLGIAVVVNLRGLQLSEDFQCSPGKVGIDDHVLQADNQAVAPKDGNEPGYAGCGKKFACRLAELAQPQCGHVFHGLFEDTVNVFIGASQRRGGLLPIVQFVFDSILAGAQHMQAAKTLVCRGVAFDEVVLANTAPDWPRFEINAEANPAVIVDGHGIALDKTRDQRATEAVMLIAANQLFTIKLPTCSYVPPADDLLRLHFEDVGEIGAQRDFEVETGALHSVIADFKVLYNAVVHGAREYQAQARGFDFAVLGGDARIDEIGPRRVVGDRPGVLQDPVLAISIEVVIADVARVTAVESLIAARSHRAVGFGEHKGVAAIDRDLRRSDSYFDRHKIVLARLGSGGE